MRGATHRPGTHLGRLLALVLVIAAVAVAVAVAVLTLQRQEGPTLVRLSESSPPKQSTDSTGPSALPPPGHEPTPLATVSDARTPLAIPHCELDPVPAGEVSFVPAGEWDVPPVHVADGTLAADAHVNWSHSRPYRLEVEGYALMLVEVHDGRCVPNPVQLSPIALTGGVSSSDGYPLPGVKIRCDVQQVVSDEAGRFQMGWPSGGCLLSASVRVGGILVRSEPVDFDGESPKEGGLEVVMPVRVQSPRGMLVAGYDPTAGVGLACYTIGEHGSMPVVKGERHLVGEACLQRVQRPIDTGH